MANPRTPPRPGTHVTLEPPCRSASSPDLRPSWKPMPQPPRLDLPRTPHDQTQASGAWSLRFSEGPALVVPRRGLVSCGVPTTSAGGWVCTETVRGVSSGWVKAPALWRTHGRWRVTQPAETPGLAPDERRSNPVRSRRRRPPGWAPRPTESGSARDRPARLESQRRSRLCCLSGPAATPARRRGIAEVSQRYRRASMRYRSADGGAVSHLGAAYRSVAGQHVVRASGETLAGMADLTLRCPRCKLILTGSDPEQLADDLLDHVAQAHGHAPPREHVLSRIERHNEP